MNCCWPNDSAIKGGILYKKKNKEKEQENEQLVMALLSHYGMISNWKDQAKSWKEEEEEGKKGSKKPTNIKKGRKLKKNEKWRRAQCKHKSRLAYIHTDILPYFNSWKL